MSSSISSHTSETSTETEENAEVLGLLEYEDPKDANEGDTYISHIQVNVESDSPIQEPGVEFRLIGELSLRKARRSSSPSAGNYLLIRHIRVDLDSRSILYDKDISLFTFSGSPPKKGEKVDAINLDQVVEDIECLLIG